MSSIKKKLPSIVRVLLRENLEERLTSGQQGPKPSKLHEWHLASMNALSVEEEMLNPKSASSTIKRRSSTRKRGLRLGTNSFDDFSSDFLGGKFFALPATKKKRTKKTKKGGKTDD